MMNPDLLPLQEESEDISLDELLLKLHRNDPVSPCLVTALAKHASFLSERICADYRTLNAIIVRHEATIRKRWLKRSQAQRRDILLEAWPNMAETHRQDYTDNASMFLNALDTNDWKHYFAVEREVLPSPTDMWPYINLEDLSKSKPLLVYLNARGRNVPFTFILSERHFSPFRKMTPCGLESELEGYDLEFSREPIPSLYGRFKDSDKTTEDEISSKTGCELCPRHNLQAMYIQQRILEFLVACSKLILHDIPQEMLLCSAVQEEPPSSELGLQNDVGFTTFADVLMIAPYRNRGSVDFLRLRAYFDALYTNAEDHVLALREDPSYFADVFEDVVEHSEELVKDFRGRIHPTVGTTAFLVQGALQVVIEAYAMLFEWKELYQIMDRLTKTSPTDSIDEFSSLMTEFGCRARKMSQIVSSTLTSYALGSPKIRNFYLRLDDHSAEPKYRMISGKIPSLEEFKWVESLDFLRTSQADSVAGDHTVCLRLDHMATLMRKSKATNDLLSPRVSELFSQMSVIGECVMQLSVWYETPQGHKIDVYADHSHTHFRRSDFAKWINHLSRIYLPVHVINLFRGKLDYPVHKARNKSNIRTMRTAESNLDRFWKCIDEFYEMQTGLAQHEVIRQCIIEGGPMRRTPPWEDPEDTKSKHTKNLEGTYLPFSETSHNKSMQVTGAFDKLCVEEKIKPKTRGSIDFPLVNEAEVDVVLAANEDDAQQVYTLDKRALKAMKTLFHVSKHENDELPRAVKWNEFTRAMVRIGFAVEQLQGSAWQFTPIGALGVSRSIHFHEPRRDSDIPYTLARRFGRRLERAYGWNSGSFKLA